LLLEEIYTSLDFEEFGENLECSKSLYVGTFVLFLLFSLSLFLFSLFFRAPKPLLKILMEVVIGIFGALLDNKRASNE
jgi:hypothetical protein